MPFNLSSVPRGLLDLLSIRSEGRAPSNLLDEARLTIEGNDFWLSPMLISMPGNGVGAPVAGYNNCLTVLPNEMWILMQGNISVTAEAGVTFVAFPALIPSSGTALIGPSFAVPAASTRYGITNPMRMALPAGARMGVFVEQLTGVPTVASSLGFTALVYRLRAGG